MSEETHCRIPLGKLVIFIVPLPDGRTGECYTESVQDWLDGNICPICEDASPKTPGEVKEDAAQCAHCEESSPGEFKCQRCQSGLSDPCATKAYTTVNPECVRAEVRRDNRERERRANCNHQFSVSPKYPGRNVRVCSKCDMMKF